MGPTGAGKTKLVNTISGSHLKVGEGLESCTADIEARTFSFDGQLVTLVDTPGFDDTTRSQADILKEIQTFLTTTYGKGHKVTGVLYLHRITDVRMGGIAIENYRIFKKICGNEAMKNVVVVTNMWGEVQEKVGAARERELVSNPLFFKDAIDRGARILRHHDTKESGYAILRSLLNKPPQVLRIQQETVDEHKTLPQTEAAEVLRNQLAEHQTDLEIKIRDTEIPARAEGDDNGGNVGHDEEDEADRIHELRSLRRQLTRLLEEVMKLQEVNQGLDARQAAAQSRVDQILGNMESLRIQHAADIKRQEDLRRQEEARRRAEDEAPVWARLWWAVFPSCKPSSQKST
ncbi:hypothetical protein CERSUDRAFT_162189 [Gelatoporia subvermispora B]|uniref:AIG1-type G domain-containing protein n=1 Tax=Ceriporiopsis subvermispora (strain B) TaxID=914234 RepID=M2QZT2_CERS8|nr:hypothetical protein CERSUDRAFT_162189 [Gelatoporia subvermispora B]